ncbi:hypothetical protein SDC9_101878 [bioreactor metagenome]|uniref:Uncharacterized protein n=1 Tax=bioreactor metagenome TaxID=1076179 RepID=A0A645AW15_9ZZZZ
MGHPQAAGVIHFSDHPGLSIHFNLQVDGTRRCTPQRDQTSRIFLGGIEVALTAFDQGSL